MITSRIHKVLCAYLTICLLSNAHNSAIAQGARDTDPASYANNINSVFNVDTFPLNGGQHRGSWSSVNEYAQCDTVTYQDSEWIVVRKNKGIPPSQVDDGEPSWTRFSSPKDGMAATQADCAFFVAYAFVASHARSYDRPASVDMEFGARLGGYLKNADWNLPSNAFGYTISMHGRGRGLTVITQNKSTMNYMVTQNAVHAANINSQEMFGITFNANMLSGGCLSVHGVRRSSYREISCFNPQQQPGGKIQYAMYLGHQGDSYELVFDGGLVRTPTVPGALPAVAKAIIGPGGSITGYDIVTPGAKLALSHDAAAPGLVTYWLGNGPTGKLEQPCKTMPDQPTYSVSPTKGTLVSMTPGVNKGSGCGGTIYIRVMRSGTIPYGWFFGATDSTFRDIVTSGEFTEACQYDVHGLNHFVHEHPYCAAPVQIRSDGKNVHDAVELDSPVRYGMSLEGQGDIVTSYDVEWNAKDYFGAGDILIGPKATFNSINASGCGQFEQVAGGYSKYTEIGQGPINPRSPLPTGFAIEGSQPNCNGTNTNWGTVIPGASEPGKQ